MICIILVAGVGSSLEEQLSRDEKLRGLPRALLPVAGRPMLSYWWDSVLSTREILNVYLVCNAKNFKHFERWATANGLPTGNVINNGATSPATSLGAARDLQLGLRRAKADGMSTKEVCVIAGDSLFFKEFDLPQVINCFHRIQKRSEESRSVSLVLYYKLQDEEDCSKRGMVEIDSVTKRVVEFKEKPKISANRLASPLFYIFGEQAVELLSEFVDNTRREGVSNAVASFSCGKFLESTVSKTCYYGMRLPGRFNLVGVSAGLEEYESLNVSFGASSPITAAASTTSDVEDEEGSGSEKVEDEESRNESKRLLAPTTAQGTTVSEKVLTFPKKCHALAYARVGLLGNPSDGFFGKTISTTIKNFHAEIFLYESETLCIKPHPLFDPTEFGSLADLYSNCLRDGYFGGLRLILGTCKKFFEFALEHNIALPKRNFTVEYDTNIPRQVGLSGSSAIVTALFRALMEFYGLTEDDIPKTLQPTFVLSVEIEEMGIQAGLQDRVVQCYQGLVWMDFDKEIMSKQGHGDYEKLDVSLLPDTLFIAYRAEPSDSGKIHSNVKQRWLDGDSEVHDAMAKFASIAQEGKSALLAGDIAQFGTLMNRNFDLRRELYSDAVVGAANINMIEIARGFGACAKFPGSGGAILGLAQSKNDFDKLREAYEDAGCVFCVLEPAP